MAASIAPRSWPGKRREGEPPLRGGVFRLQLAVFSLCGSPALGLSGTTAASAVATGAPAGGRLQPALVVAVRGRTAQHARRVCSPRPQSHDFFTEWALIFRQNDFYQLAFAADGHPRALPEKKV